MRSSRSCSGSNKSVRRVSIASVTVTWATLGISTESAAAATGRFFESRMVNSTREVRDSSAPRQRRGRKALIGVSARSPAPSGNDWKDYAILIACGVIGAIVGRLLRLPASFMMGPMIVSAIAHLGGFTNSQPPGFLVAAAQVVVGTGIGCRFVGANFDRLHKEMAASIGGAFILIACAVGFAEITVALTGLNLDATVLSYAPGGFAEMSLIGLALGIEVAMVATHHLFRLFLIIITGPIVFRTILRRARR